MWMGPYLARSHDTASRDPGFEPAQGRKADLLTLSPGGLQPSPRALPERPKSAGCPLPVPCSGSQPGVRAGAVAYLGRVPHCDGVATHPLPGEGGPQQPGWGPLSAGPACSWARSSRVSLSPVRYRLPPDHRCIHTPPPLGVAGRRRGSHCTPHSLPTCHVQFPKWPPSQGWHQGSPSHSA